MIAAIPAWMTDIAAIAVVITAVGGAAIMLNRFGHGVIDAIREIVVEEQKPLHDALEVVQEKVEAIIPALSRVEREVTLNGGSSLKDLVKRQGEQIVAAASLAAEVKADLDAAHRRADSVPASAEAGSAADAAASQSNLD